MTMTNQQKRPVKPYFRTQIWVNLLKNVGVIVSKFQDIFRKFGSNSR